MRYAVIEGSYLGHSCCHEATVVDTNIEKGKEGYVVCECVDIAMAHIIASALNEKMP